MTQHKSKISRFLAMLLTVLIFSSNQASIGAFAEFLADDTETTEETTEVTTETVEEMTEETTEEETENFLQYSQALMLLAADGGDTTYTLTTCDLSADYYKGTTTYPNGDHVWDATNPASGHNFAFSVSYQVSGEGKVEPGEMKIEIPLHILKDSAGNYADTLVLPVPTKDEADDENSNLDSDVKFAYYITKNSSDEDVAVIYNFRDVEMAASGSFTVSYATEKMTFAYNDYGKADCKSDDFYAKLYLYDENTDKDSKEKTVGPVYINTTATIDSTEKRTPTVYTTWDSKWGDYAVLTENDGTSPDDYYYLIWEIRSTISDDVTQYYTFSLLDTPKTDGLEFIAYKFSGQSTYSKTNYIENQTLTGLRYDYVITRHSKADFSPEQVTSWSFKNRIDATVTPEDRVDAPTTAAYTKIFNYQFPVFTGGGPGTVGASKTADGYWRTYWLLYNKSYTNLKNLGMVAGNYSRYDMDAMFGDHSYLKVLDGLDYALTFTAKPMSWTLMDGADSSDTNNYFQSPVRYDIVDDELYLYEDGGNGSMTENRLEYGDYQLDKVTFAVTLYDSRFDDTNKEFVARSHTYTDDDTIEIYGKYHNNVTNTDEWILKDTINLKNSRTVTFSDFGDDCLGYKLSTTNAYYQTIINSVPSYSLKKSDNVLAIYESLGKPDSLGIYNRSRYTVTDATDTVKYNSTRADSDFIRAVQKDSYLNKTAVATTNDTRKRTFTISWNVTVKETITSGTGGDVQEVQQVYGTFYDLLPEGSIFTTDSLFVQSGGVTIDPSMYTVQTVPNYKGCGRTLLVVKIYQSGGDYALFYDTVHSWDSIQDWGENVYNPVAYQTGNPNIADGQNNNGEVTDFDDDAINNLMEHLDEEDNGDTFIFSDADVDILVLTATSAGLNKKVYAQGSTGYSDIAETSSNGDYSYRIRYANSNMSKSSDLIFYDSLENFVASGKASQWHGTISSFDTKQLEQMGIAPVIYVCEADLDFTGGINAIPTDNFAIQNGKTIYSQWVELNEYLAAHGNDYSGIKSFAIDCTKDKNGETFWLQPGQSLSIYVNMNAPASASVPGEPSAIPETYNKIFMTLTEVSVSSTGEGEPVPHAINQEHTTVYFRITRDLHLKKVNAQDEDETIPGVTFRLHGTSDYGTSYDLFATTNANGTLNFSKIEKGTYHLQEYSGVDDFLEDHTEHEVKITDEGKVLIDGVEQTEYFYTVTNEPRIHGDLLLRKVDESNPNIYIPDTTFRISGTSDYGNAVNIVATSNALGVVRLNNIEKGSYEMVEIKANDKYVLDSKTYKVIVDSLGNVTIDNMTPDENDYYVLTNEPRYHNFNLLKVDKDNPSKYLEGAVFTLVGTSDLGNPYHVAVTSDINGVVTFTDIERGTYILTETKAPTSDGKSYVADTKQYTVKVLGDGTVTITADGTSLGTTLNGYFIFPNERAIAGQVSVFKIWDDLDISKRQPPQLTLTNSENISNRGITVTKNWVGDIATLRPNDVTVHLWEKNTFEGGEYTVVEYIDNSRSNPTSSNGAYINTGLKPNENWKVNIVYEDITTGGSNYVMGARPGSGYDNTAIYYALSGTQRNQEITIIYNYVNDYTKLVEKREPGTKYDITLGMKYENGSGYQMTAEGTNITKNETISAKTGYYTESLTDMNITSNYCIFGFNEGCVHNGMRVYSCRIWDGNNLVRDFVPVVNSSNVYGLYDQVEGKFYPSSKTDTAFTGPERPSAGGTEIAKTTSSRWVKNGDTWTYMFNVVVEKGKDYYVTEDTVDGYTTSPTGEITVDKDTNTAEITNTAYSDKKDFVYTGEYQTYTVPYSGYYLLETWGAQGGSSYKGSSVSARDTDNPGGKGGYSYGMVWLEKDQTIYVSVGGQGGTVTGEEIIVIDPSYGSNSTRNRQVVDKTRGWNGGGGATIPDYNRSSKPTEKYGGGGGATSIQLTLEGDGQLKNYSSVQDQVLLVAGGGGGSAYYYNPKNNNNHYGTGGSGGGTNGGNSSDTLRKAGTDITHPEAVGGTQGNGGCVHSGFGYGAEYAAQNAYDSAGGGGGWYGGGSTDLCGGAGGSGHVGDSMLTGKTIGGTNDDEWIGYVNYDSSSTSTNGNEGNGYARITFISTDSCVLQADVGEIRTKQTTAAASNSLNAPSLSLGATLLAADPNSTLTWTQVTEDSKWIVVDEYTWRYDFDITDLGATYYLWESDMLGYTSKYMGEPQNLTSMRVGDSYIVTITNTGEKDLGSLKISKELLNADGTTLTSDQTFEMTVKLEGTYIKSGTQVIDGYIFVNGETYIYLKGGETVTIKDIPAGTKYTVTETAVDGFDVTYSDESGTITKDETASCTVTNQRKPIDVVDFTLEKKVIGTAAADTEYGFTVLFAGLTPSMEYHLSDGTSFTATANGDAIVTVKLKADGKVTFQGIDVGATYIVTEEAGAYTSSYKIADSENVGSITQVQDSNKDEDTELSTALEYADKDEQITITYTNKVNATQQLVIKKAVDGTNTDKQASYVFKIELDGMTQGTRVTSSIGVFIADDEGHAEKTTTLTNGKEIVIYNIPVGAKYTVTELANNMRSSYVITEGESVVKSTDSNAKSNTALATAQETVDVGENAVITYTNTHPVSDLTVTKTVTGNFGSKADKFDFTVVFTPGENTLPDEISYMGTIDGTAVNNTLTVKDNQVTFRLGHNDSITLLNLPAGVQYTVNETADTSYTVTSTGASGTISDLSDNTAAFVNTRTSVIPTDVKTGVGAVLILSVFPIGLLVYKRKRKREA